MGIVLWYIMHIWSFVVFRKFYNPIDFLAPATRGIGFSDPPIFSQGLIAPGTAPVIPDEIRIKTIQEIATGAPVCGTSFSVPLEYHCDITVEISVHVPVTFPDSAWILSGLKQ